MSAGSRHTPQMSDGSITGFIQSQSPEINKDTWTFSLSNETKYHTMWFYDDTHRSTAAYRVSPYCSIFPPGCSHLRSNITVAITKKRHTLLQTLLPILFPPFSHYYFVLWLYTRIFIIHSSFPLASFVMQMKISVYSCPETKIMIFLGYWELQDYAHF